MLSETGNMATAYGSHKSGSNILQAAHNQGIFKGLARNANISLTMTKPLMDKVNRTKQESPGSTSGNLRKGTERPVS